MRGVLLVIEFVIVLGCLIAVMGLPELLRRRWRKWFPKRPPDPMDLHPSPHYNGRR